MDRQVQEGERQKGGRDYCRQVRKISKQWEEAWTVGQDKEMESDIDVWVECMQEEGGLFLQKQGLRPRTSPSKRVIDKESEAKSLSERQYCSPFIPSVY